MAEVPVVFVFLGNKLPEYAFHGLFLARQNYEGDIVLLSDQADTKVPDGVTFIDVSAWYQNDPFQAFSLQSPLDALFRGGFWLKAVERFFVLQQYMRQFAVETLFHAELDVLILDLGGLAPSLDSEGKGVFIPSQRPGRAIASLVYINDTAALDELVAFFSQNSHLGNEMNMLGAFLAEHPEHGVALPTEAILSPSAWPHTPRYAQASVGAIDAQWVGHHLFGYGPRNIMGTSWNRFSEGPVPQDFVGTRFRYRRGILTAKAPGGASTVVRAIHVHAKILRRLRSPLVLSFYCWVAELPLPNSYFCQFQGSAGTSCDRTVVQGINEGFLHLAGSRRETVRPFGSLDCDKLAENPLRERTSGVNEVPAEEILWCTGSEPVNPGRGTRRRIRRCRSGPSPPRSPGGESSAKARRQHECFSHGTSQQGAATVLSRRRAPCRKPTVGALHAENVARGEREEGLPRNKTRPHLLGFAYFQYVVEFFGIMSARVPRVFRMMFPGGFDDVLSWVQIGFNRPRPSLSAIQSYGLWLFSQERSRVVLVRAENVSE